ncbi:hypothetical protein [Fibrobacter sp. HC4]|uniref:hypothetical protein n=1 Tax=Fibrobacter sp. HC4 TaxID=3239812 RepID=UPI002019BC29|nr:hypothetical protein [Fibrobacter succinogenes]MCL4102010.1 hypothetical protein [Fibrobacter succinogenes]
MAVSLACSAEIACSGLFLSNRDSVHVGSHTFFGGIDYLQLEFQWIEGWDLDVGWNTANFMAGFQSEFDHVLLGASFKGISLGVGRMVWTPEEGTGLPVIDAGWESSLLQKDAWAEVEFGGYRLRGSLGNVSSSPVNRDEEYYIRDSLDVWILSAGFGLDRLGAELNYTYVSADLFMQGIRSQDGNRKRFLYLPFSGSFHLIDFGIDIGPVNVSAAAARMELHLTNSGSRFYESLAPNRALPNSVLQVLSFSFLQKNFRETADMEISAVMVGAAYRKPFGLGSAGGTRSLTLEPVVSADFFYADGSIDGKQVEETTVLFATASKETAFGREASCFGTFVGLGLNLKWWRLALSLHARQIVPLYIDVQKTADGMNSVEGGEISDPSAGGTSGGPSIISDDSRAIARFGNGMFVTASLTFSI